jgi:ribosome assembly protein 1
LPKPIAELVVSNVSLLQRLGRDSATSFEAEAAAEGDTADDRLDTEENAEATDGGHVGTSFMNAEDFAEALKSACTQVGGDWKNAYDNVWMFGPHGSGPNLLLDRRPAGQRHLQCVLSPMLHGRAVLVG